MKWLGPAAVVVLAILAEVALGRASGGPDFALFFGRFHPLIVHLPIGFFLLVAMGEAATFVPALRERVEPALGLLVPVSAIAALGAFLMGQLLALEGGFPAGALGWHRRLTLGAVVGISLCWVLYDRQRSKDGQGRWLYRGVMGAALGLLSLGAHFGGTMTRGESYLSKYAPGPLKPLLGAPDAKPEVAKGSEKPAAPSVEPLVFQDVLQPILKAHCVECHGPEKQKGKLRLDSLEEILKGGENGAAVVAGNAKKSSLIARMLLPITDDDHMPPEKPGPKPEERALIEFWIDRGASPTLKVRDALAPAVSRSLLEHALGGSAPTDSVPVSAGAAAPSDASAPATSPSPPSDPNSAAKDAATPSNTKAATKDAAAPSVASTPSEAAVATEPAAAQPAAAMAPAGGVTSGPAFLATHCEKCHGAQKQKGKLRVDSVAALLRGGAGGPALVPGSPDQSSILKRVRLALSDDEHMPPKKEAQPTPAEVAVLAAWIRSSSGGSAQASAVAAKSIGGSTSTGSSTAATGTAAGIVATPTPGTDSGVASGAPASTTASTVATTPSNAAPDSGTSTTANSDTSATANSTTSVGAAVASASVSGPPDPVVLQSLPAQVALFTDAVQPLLREKCGKCHIREKPAGGLGVEKHAQLLEGGFSGAGIVPKDRQASLVLARLVLPPNDDEHMPPEDEPTLNAEEIELVGSWIDQGAPAQGLIQTASLTAGAARALLARGIKGSDAPPAVSAQAGGCGACSVPGAPHPKFLELQALAFIALSTVFASRRHRHGNRRRHHPRHS